MNAEPNTIWDVFSRMASADLPVLLLLFAVFATLLIIVIAVIVSKTIYRMHKNRLEDTLKRELVDRGFSAQEIAQVIECAPPLEDATSRWIASWADKKTTG